MGVISTNSGGARTTVVVVEERSAGTLQHGVQIPPRLHDVHAVPDQLAHVLVGGAHHHTQPGRARPPEKNKKRPRNVGREKEKKKKREKSQKEQNTGCPPHRSIDLAPSAQEEFHQTEEEKRLNRKVVDYILVCVYKNTSSFCVEWISRLGRYPSQTKRATKLAACALTSKKSAGGRHQDKTAATLSTSYCSRLADDSSSESAKVVERLPLKRRFVRSTILGHSPTRVSMWPTYEQRPQQRV